MFKRTEKLIVTLALSLTAPWLYAAPGDIFIQVDSAGSVTCSIMRVDRLGGVSEYITLAEILAVTGETTANCGDTGLAVDDDGTVYFSEDASDTIMRITPTGVLSIFVTEATLDAAVSANADLDNGMTIGSDGNLYVADEETDSVLQVTIPGGAVSVVITKAEIVAVLGGDVDLEGGIAMDASGTFFLTNDTDQNIIMVAPGPVITELVSEADINAVLGVAEIDLDVAVVLGDRLYVLNDDSDTLFSVNVNNGTVVVIADEAALDAGNGAAGIDVEGGLAMDESGNFYIGDNGSDSILQVTPAGVVSVFVSTSTIEALYPGDDPDLQGSMAIQAFVPIVPVPSLSVWGLLLMSFSLIVLARRRC